MAREIKAPCGDTVSAETNVELGVELSQHQSGCSECQDILEALRREIYGE